MKKLLFTFLIAVTLTACGTAYNSQLKQVQLGMTSDQIIALMGEKYNVVDQRNNGETLEYVDRYKNHWYFQFQNDRLVKWHKETE